MPLLLSPVSASATDFTAGIVATEMDERDRYPFMAGIVEGLAYARYAEEGKTTNGMKCIYRWFYDAKSRPQEILAVFKRFPDYTPGAVIAAMMEKECGR
ncbi:MAG: hypothetical protein M9905_03595 [Rhizobiaceae bacterium]|nr:hypothetical protein [Rhizobiaceae bacterium]